MKYKYRLRTFWENRDERASFHRTHERVANDVVEAIVQEIAHNVQRMTEGMSEEGFYVAKVRVIRFLGSVIDDDYIAFHEHMQNARRALHSARCYASKHAPTLGSEAGPWPEPDLKAAAVCFAQAMEYRRLAKQYL